MKVFFKLLILLFWFKGTIIVAQVGTIINNPNKDAILDLNTTSGVNNKGLLLPKVALTSTNNSSPLSANIAGMKIYNTATVGTGATAVSPGEYYNDGSQWIRISDNIWEFNGNANTIASTNFIGTTDAKDLVLKTNNTEVMRITSAGNVGIGTSSPNAKLDIRTNPTSTTDPGDGYIGLGTTNIQANTAGAGAIRYNTAKAIEYSNGIVWSRLEATLTKTVVVAKKITPQTVSDRTFVFVDNWMEITDNNNTFDALTGTFTAPRDGQYTISFNFNFISSYSNAGIIEAVLEVIGTVRTVRRGYCTFPQAGYSEKGALISYVFDLKAGDKVNPRIWSDLGFAQAMRVGSVGGGDDGFVNFSVGEL